MKVGEWQIYDKDGKPWGILESRQYGFLDKMSADHFVCIYTGNATTYDGLEKALHENNLVVRKREVLS